MNRIERKFKDLDKLKRKAFISFITAGYPDLAATEKLVREFERAGVDIVELGVPFSDPMADGPVIQEASQHALEKNVHLIDILRMVKRARLHVRLPIVLMTYYNPVFCFGEEKFISQARACGVDGVIIPDLPPEEGRAFISRSRKAGLDVICFLSPTSPLPRVKYIASVTKGFIYYVSLTGVTGARKALPADLKNNLALIKRYTSKPVCVGFGVSTAAQVKAVSSIADGVIVGSAIIGKIKENIGKADLVKNVTGFVSSLIGGR